MDNSCISLGIDAARDNLVKQLKIDGRKVYDSVYGFITFPKLIWKFIDTPHFQRLRDIKQLGCLSWVFPGAMHSRFQHSLGTGHLAQKYITTIINTVTNPESQKYNHEVSQNYEGKIKIFDQDYVSIKEQAIFTVTLAGVMHDIGHGPYSHLFDSSVISYVYKNKDESDQSPENKFKWTHQLAGLYILQDLFERISYSNKFQKQWILTRVKPRVQSLILGKEEKGCNQYNQIFKKQLEKRHWEFEIISNRITGIDVDKLDYFRRDAYYTGAKNIYIDHQLLMNETFILESGSTDLNKKFRISYPSKYSEKVYDVYFSRYKLYKTYYYNLKSNGVDSMIKQIIILAAKKLQLKEICWQLIFGGEERTKNRQLPIRYLRLTDHILQRIQIKYLESPQSHKGTDLQRSFRILQKLRNRQIYDFMRESHQCYTMMGYKSFDQTKKQSLKQFIKGFLKNNSDFDIMISEIGYGIKDYDPFDQLCFFEKSSKQKHIIRPNNKYFFSMLRPQNIIQVSVRMYYNTRVNKLNKEKRQQILNTTKDVFQKIQNKFELVPGNQGTFQCRDDFERLDESEIMRKTKELQNMDKNF